MIKTKLFSKLLALACVFTVLLPTAAYAQTATGQPFIHINDIKPVQQVQGPAGVPGLSLEVTFTMLDGDENVQAGSEVESANFILDNGEVVPAQVGGIAQPWSVVLLVDASASMANFSASAAYKTARTALSDSLGNQQNVSFKLLKFDNRAPEVKGFNAGVDEIKKALGTLRATQNGNACMHNGLIEAITQLSGAPGRRGIILFSASLDNCSQSTAQDVVNLANQNNVEIYAVGLRGYTITQQALQDFTDGTGGLARLENEATIGFAFRNMMAVLSSQFSAKATLFPPAGKQNAELDIVLKNQTQLKSDPIPFESPQDFIPPPQIQFKGTVLSRNDGISFNLDIINPDRIKELEINIVSKKTGLSVFSRRVEEFGETNIVPVGGLELGGAYQLFVTALDERGQQLSQTGAEFEFQPPPLQLAVTSLDPATLEKPQFSIGLEPAAPEGVVKFEVTMLTGQDNLPVNGMSDSFAVGDPIIIPVVDSLTEGEYFFVVSGQDGTGKVLVEAASPKFRYAPPTWIDKFVAFTKSSPLTLVAITGVCGLALVALVAVVVLFVWRPGSRVKEVEILVPEKQVRQARPTDSGYFDRPGSVDIPPPPPSRRSPEPPPQQSAPRAAPPPSPRAAPPPADMPSASLIAQEPATALVRTEIRKTSLSIGRRSGNDIVLNVDASSGVSGQHCSVNFTNGKYYVQDNGSSYGTTVNGKTVPKGIPFALEDGAVIGMGPKVKIQFRLGK